MDINQLQLNWLDENNRREVKAFYRQFMPYARLNRKEAIAVFQTEDKLIVASVRFRTMGECRVLTGLLVSPLARELGLATRLLNKACPYIATKPIYLFAEADLVLFYQGCGFKFINQGPNDIEQLLIKYQLQGKPLLVMQYID